MNCIVTHHEKTHNRMMIWLIFAGMTAAVVAALLVPFMRKSANAQSPDFGIRPGDIPRPVAGAGPRQGPRPDRRDRGPAARNEISRRLLQVANPQAPAAGKSYALLAVLLVPLIALPIYVKYGSPRMLDVPLQERLKGAIANQDFEALVATVEAHLAKSPNDAEGWKVLAPAYKRERRWSDAADAYGNILRLAPPTADAIADYGEMLVFANEGMVTDEAERAFVEALKLEATNERAKYYYDMALKQEGKAPALSDQRVSPQGRPCRRRIRRP